jgi:multiple sugar transport system permease protein
LIGLLVYTAYPTLFGLYVSFTKYSAIAPPRWTGLDNYVTLLHDKFFWHSLRTSALFTLVMTPLQLASALTVALLLNQALPWRNLLRTGFYVPSIVPWVAAGLLWKDLLNYKYGLFNTLLQFLGLPPVPWINPDNVTAMFWSVILVALWKGLGGTMLIYLAALQDVPEQLYDAAKVDGANRWGRFWAVTLPSIQPISVFLLIITVLGTMATFTPIYILGGGVGPYSMSRLITVPVYVYQTAFMNFLYGYGSAVQWVMFLFLFGFTYTQLHIITRSKAEVREVA